MLTCFCGGPVKTYLEIALPSSNLDFLMSEINQSDTFLSLEVRMPFPELGTPQIFRNNVLGLTRQILGPGSRKNVLERWGDSRQPFSGTSDKFLQNVQRNPASTQDMYRFFYLLFSYLFMSPAKSPVRPGSGRGDFGAIFRGEWKFGEGCGERAESDAWWIMRDDYWVMSVVMIVEYVDEWCRGVECMHTRYSLEVTGVLPVPVPEVLPVGPTGRVKQVRKDQRWEPAEGVISTSRDHWQG